jgi:hypothetical protein
MVGLRNVITADNVDDGFARIQEILRSELDVMLLYDAVEVCVRDNLIHDPVRLEAGALQCHWRLELTPKGAQTARTLVEI